MSTASQGPAAPPEMLQLAEPTSTPIESRAIQAESEPGATSADFRHRFTIAEFERLHILGFINEDEQRYELLDGDLIAMSRILGPHASCINRLTGTIPERLGRRASCLVQNPIYLNETSQPQPDFTIAVRREDGYAVHPRPEELHLVIEVMDSSGPRDRKVKLPLYAAAGIRETWLIDLPGHFIERHRSPIDGIYSERTILRPGEMIAPEAFPDLILPVDFILRWPE